MNWLDDNPPPVTGYPDAPFVGIAMKGLEFRCVIVLDIHFPFKGISSGGVSLSFPQKKKLIIADDLPIFRLGLRNVLSQIDWVEIVREAETSVSALIQAQHIQPDILLLDLEMPGMGGLSVLVGITRQASRQPGGDCYQLR